MALIDRFIGPVLDRYFARQLTQGFGGVQTNSGQTVTRDTPFELVAVRSAINVLSADVATLPLKLYRKEGRGRQEETAHPLSGCLRLAPNPRMTAFEMREAMMVSLLTWGNAYAYIQRDEAYRVIALWPFRPDRMTVYLGEDGRLKYHYLPLNSTIEAETFDVSDILHVKGLSSDGLVGRTPLWDYREKLGESAATERFSQSFYGNGMKRGAVLKHPSAIGDTAYKHLKESLADERGADKAWKTLILEEGMDFSELTFAPEDAQLLETRRFTVEDWCRVFNLPLFKLRINTPGAVSYASVDAQSVDYLVSTLTPWLVRIEQAIDRACLTLPEREAGLYVEHNTRALLRSDLKSQAEALAIGREKNWYSVNDCREMLGENPDPDPRADDRFTPTFIQTVADDSLSAKATTVGALIRAGFNANDAARIVGLPRMEYEDVQPITVRPITADGVQVAPTAADKVETTTGAANGERPAQRNADAEDAP